MCMAIPMQVVGTSPDGMRASCQGRNGPTEVDTLITGPVAPGQWVLTFLGSAREIVSADEAARVDAALDALEAVLRGGPVDRALLDEAFADLVNREPELPEHLRPRQ